MELLKINKLAYDGYGFVKPVNQTVADIFFPATKQQWQDHAIVRLDRMEHSLDRLLPPFFFQKKIDQIAGYIETKFAPLYYFNRWLECNGEGAWYSKLATFLYKLPMRVIRNFIVLLYQAVRAILQTTLHPLKAVVKLAKLLVKLVQQITHPDVWSKIGASIVGASLGQSCMAGGPISLIGALIGNAMILSGVSLSALKASLRATRGEGWKEARNALFYQLEQLPEAMLTGFSMGLLLGSIQRHINAKAKNMYDEAIKNGVNEKLAEYGLPPSSDVTLDASRAVVVKWPIEEISVHKRWYMQSFYDTTTTRSEFVLTIPSKVANIPPLEFPPWLKQSIEGAPLSASLLPQNNS